MIDFDEYLSRCSSITDVDLLESYVIGDFSELFMCHPDVQTLEELSLSVLSRLEEVVKEQQRWREIAEAHIQLLRDFAFQEWLCSQNLEHYYHA